MSDINKSGSGKTGAALVSTFFIFAGAVTLWDTQSYTDRDSQVFPQTVAIVLILCAISALVMTLLKGDESEGFGKGVWWRRVLLVVSLLTACFAMPYIGFLASGVLAFLGGLVAAMHDRWSAKTALLYSISGLAVMCAFYTIFRYVLLVPLP